MPSRSTIGHFASSDELNAGNWYLPHPQRAPWVDSFLFELSAFPRGRHDRWLEAWTQAREVLGGAGVAHYSMYTAEAVNELHRFFLRQGFRPEDFTPPGLRPWWDP